MPSSKPVKLPNWEKVLGNFAGKVWFHSHQGDQKNHNILSRCEADVKFYENPDNRVHSTKHEPFSTQKKNMDVSKNVGFSQQPWGFPTKNDHFGTPIFGNTLKWTLAKHISLDGFLSLPGPIFAFSNSPMITWSSKTNGKNGPKIPLRFLMFSNWVIFGNNNLFPKHTGHNMITSVFPPWNPLFWKT